MPLAVDGNSSQPDPKYPVGFAHPKVRAGSATYPLDVIAGISSDHRSLRIAVVNATFKPQALAISLQGIAARGRGKVWQLTGKSLEASNKVGRPAEVTIRESTAALRRPLTVPPISTSIYEFPLAR